MLIEYTLRTGDYNLGRHEVEHKFNVDVRVRPEHGHPRFCIEVNFVSLVGTTIYAQPEFLVGVEVEQRDDNWSMFALNIERWAIGQLRGDESEAFDEYAIKCYLREIGEAA